jgi:drug/metabolite transporter (DMT)-like permease
LFGTLAAIWVLNEELTTLKLVAGSLIVAGVWINSFNARKNTSQ